MDRGATESACVTPGAKRGRVGDWPAGEQGAAWSETEEFRPAASVNVATGGQRRIVDRQHGAGNTNRFVFDQKRTKCSQRGVGSGSADVEAIHLAGSSPHMRIEPVAR